MEQTWDAAQEWERQWHGDCANSFHEEEKQYVYASRMGLDRYVTNFYGRKGWDFGSKSVIDIGGGAYSLLNKSVAARKAVVDPCNYPDWVRARYDACNVEFYKIPAENINSGIGKWDMALIYNCLQHTIDPEQIIRNVKAISKEIHIFEWIDTGTNIGHLHDLKEDKLNKWLGGEGKVTDINESGAVGKCYYGIFKGDRYEEV